MIHCEALCKPILLLFVNNLGDYEKESNED